MSGLPRDYWGIYVWFLAGIGTGVVISNWSKLYTPIQDGFFTFRTRPALTFWPQKYQTKKLARDTPSPPETAQSTHENLPTTEETALSRREVSKEEIAEAILLSGFLSSPRKVLKLGSNIVAKIGPSLDLGEAESMTFIRDNTTIPVPKVLNAYEKEGCRYILMEFIEGQVLEQAWPSLSSSERGVIISQLKGYVRQMRQIAVPDDTHIGSVNGGPATDRRSQGSVKGGPFDSEAAFNEWQIAQLQPHTRRLHRDIYSSMHKTEHRVVFSHCDLGFHNIIVRDGQVVAVIDWEDSGWYPEHWDYCKALSFLSATDEHYLCCQEMFEQTYHSEFLMDSWFTREVRHGGF